MNDIERAAIIAAGWQPARCPELPGDWWRHPSRGGRGHFVYSTEQVMAELGAVASPEPAQPDHQLTEGDRVVVADGSRFHGVAGCVLRRLDDGLILVELDGSDVCWPVTADEIAAAL